jgi:hypothetical protein
MSKTHDWLTNTMQHSSRLMAAAGAAALATALSAALGSGPVRSGRSRRRLQLGASHRLAPLSREQRGCHGGWFPVRDSGSPARLPQPVGGED